MTPRKPRPNASWLSLSPEARDQIESWLFDEHMSYIKAFEKAKAELNYPGALSSFKRFGLHLAQDRVIRQFADSAKQARAIEKAKTSEDELRNAGMKVMAQAFLQQVTQFPENVNQWGWIAKLLVQNQENQLRNQTLDLARERFEFDASKAALKIAPIADEIREEVEDRQSDILARIRHKLFGNEPDEDEVDELNENDSEFEEEGEDAAEPAPTEPEPKPAQTPSNNDPETPASPHQPA